MDIIFYHPSFDTQFWLDKLSQALPDARVREWKPGDNEPADYALVWHPPVDMLQGRSLKAVFALGAGVDSILSQLNAHPDMLPESIPLFSPRRYRHGIADAGVCREPGSALVPPL
ncbi:2-ketoacid reductase [Pseudescherichia vulneris]|nr:2-ketoacid reductase [Pseudescherichia vulneris]